MKELVLIAGPCVIESRELVLSIAEKVKEITEGLEIEFIFKASFDKANRSSGSSFRGPGLEKGLEILAEVKDKYSLKVLTDIHDKFQAKIVAEVVDIIQIPAFLCRQTDLLLAGEVIKDSDKKIIKKGQFLTLGMLSRNN